MITTKTEEKLIKHKKFKGDILITDPCYIIKKVDKTYCPDIMNYFSYDDITKYPDYDGLCSKQMEEERLKYYKDLNKWDNEHDDWAKSNYGFKCECLGIKNYLTNDTLYGDWGCTTYNKDTNEILGEFCADAGLVSVFLLDEVRAYNPDIDNWIKNHSWCATVIPNFEGTVNFIQVHSEGTYASTTEYWNEGDSWSDDILIVEGEGNINFITKQTSL